MNKMYKDVSIGRKIGDTYEFDKLQGFDGRNVRKGKIIDIKDRFFVVQLENYKECVNEYRRMYDN